jgi:hypothetical protein
MILSFVPLHILNHQGIISHTGKYIVCASVVPVQLVSSKEVAESP